MSGIVPFGKYKGQPVELLIADRDYCDWLASQPWFAERFRDVYNVVINAGAPPEDTPEHNQLQARFLDDAFCLRFGQRRPARQRYYQFDDREAALRGWQNRVVAHLNYAAKYSKENPNQSQSLHDQLKAAQLSFSYTEIPLRVSNRAFEVAGWDVVFVLAEGGTYTAAGIPDGIKDKAPSDFWDNHDAFYVECKPTLGDDYPAILRQIKGYGLNAGIAENVRHRHRVLLLGAFQARGATFGQMKAIFAQDNIAVIELAEIEGQHP